MHGFTGTSLIQNAAKTIGAEEHVVVATKLKSITMKFLADKAPEAKKHYPNVLVQGRKNFVLQGGLRNADGRDMWRSFPSNLPSPKFEYNLPNPRAFVNLARWGTWKGGEMW